MTRAVKKVTVTLPVDALRAAQRVTGKGITPTVIDGLLELTRREQRSALRALKGKIHFDLDLPSTRR